jgi:hypothetical protein
MEWDLVFHELFDASCKIYANPISIVANNPYQVNLVSVEILFRNELNSKMTDSILSTIL